MTIAELRGLITELESEYEYTDDTLVYIKDNSNDSISLEGFFVGEGGRLFIG